MLWDGAGEERRGGAVKFHCQRALSFGSRTYHTCSNMAIFDVLVTEELQWLEH